MQHNFSQFRECDTRDPSHRDNIVHKVESFINTYSRSTLTLFSAKCGYDRNCLISLFFSAWHLHGVCMWYKIDLPDRKCVLFNRQIYISDKTEVSMLNRTLDFWDEYNNIEMLTLWRLDECVNYADNWISIGDTTRAPTRSTVVFLSYATVVGPAISSWLLGGVAPTTESTADYHGSKSCLTVSVADQIRSWRSRRQACRPKHQGRTHNGAHAVVLVSPAIKALQNMSFTFTNQRPHIWHID